MNIFFHIIRFKLLSYIKETFNFKPKSITRSISTLFIYGLFAFGVYSFSFSTTKYVLESTRTGLFLYHTFISMMLFVFFMSVNLGNIIVSYSTLYKSNEVNFLFTKPVPFTKIFILKFLDNFFHSSTTLFLAAFMVLLGYGNYFGYPWYFYLAFMICVLIPFMFLSGCIAVMILMGIMKIAGKVGFRKVMSALFVLYAVFVFVFFKISNPISVVEKINIFSNIDEYVKSSMPAFLQYLPNRWVSDCLYYLAKGDFVNALLYVALILSVTFITFLICLLIARRYYYKSWLISLELHSQKTTSENIFYKWFIGFKTKSFLRPQTESLFKKELIIFFREPSQWIHLIVMIILASIFSISIANINYYRLKILDMQIITYLVLFSFGGFMINSLALRFIFPMIGLEGTAFWSILSSPMQRHKIFLVKFFMGLSLVFVIALYIAVFSNVPFVKIAGGNPFLIWLGIVLALSISITNVFINLGLGAYLGDYKEQNPIRAASTQSATLTFLLMFMYLILTVIIIYFPISIYFKSIVGKNQPQLDVFAIPIILITVVSFLFSYAGYKIGLQSLKKDF